MAQYNAKNDTSSRADAVKPFMEVLQMLFKWFLNNTIKKKLKPHFRRACDGP